MTAEYKFAFSLLLPFLLACQGSEGPPGPLLTGEIQGRVVLLDDAGIQLGTYQGVQVSIQGTNISTLSDSVGKWKLENVSTGIYSILFRKAGFFDLSYEGFQFVGGGTLTLGSTLLYAVPSFQVVQLAATVDTSFDFFRVYGVLSRVSPNSYAVLICYDTTRGVSPENFTFLESAYVYRNGNSFDRITSMDSTFKSQYQLKSGNTLYMRAYPGSGIVIQYDLYTGQNRPNNIIATPSPMDSVIIP